MSNTSNFDKICNFVFLCVCGGGGGGVICVKIDGFANVSITRIFFVLFVGGGGS